MILTDTEVHSNGSIMYVYVSVCFWGLCVFGYVSLDMCVYVCVYLGVSVSLGVRVLVCVFGYVCT